MVREAASIAKFAPQSEFFGNVRERIEEILAAAEPSWHFISHPLSRLHNALCSSAPSVRAEPKICCAR